MNLRHLVVLGSAIVLPLASLMPPVAHANKAAFVIDNNLGSHTITSVQFQQTSDASGDYSWVDAGISDLSPGDYTTIDFTPYESCTWNFDIAWDTGGASYTDVNVCNQDGISLSLP